MSFLNAVPRGVITQANTVLADDQQTLVGAVETTVVTYTAVAQTRISFVHFSGGLSAIWRFKQNGALISTHRTAPELSGTKFFDINIAVTDTFSVTVEHAFTGETEDFEGAIFGF